MQPGVKLPLTEAGTAESGTHKNERVIIIAPVGNDAGGMAALLHAEGFEVQVCPSAEACRSEIITGAGALLLTEEALESPQVDGFLQTLQSQPPWSELPLIILTSGGESHLARLLDLTAATAGNVTLLERPMAGRTLVRSVQVALNSRHRQYQVRDLLAQQECAQEQLRQSQERVRQQLTELEAIYHTAPLGLAVLDCELRYQRVNNRLAENHGISAEKHLGRLVRDVVPSLARQAEDALRRTLETGQPLVFEFRGETPAQPGVERIWDKSWYPLRDAQGKIVGVGFVAEEITERRRVEAALQKALAKAEEGNLLLAALMENVPEGIIIADAPDVTIRMVSRVGRELTGKPREVIEGIPFEEHTRKWDIYCADGVTPARNEDLPLTRAVKTGELVVGEEWVLGHPDGRRISILCNAAPIRDAAGQIVKGVIVWRDITERKQAEVALREAHEQLSNRAVQLETLVQERTAKLQHMVDELQHVSYAIAHDMRAPLRAMGAFASLLGEEAESSGAPAQTKDYTRRIIVAATRLDRLIQDSLHYTKVGQQEMPVDAVDLSKLVRDLIDVYPNLHPDKANIFIEGELALVLGNDSLLTQCFSNLIGNAVKFVAPGVKPEIRLRAEQRDGTAKIWIKDNGIGIPKHAQERLFGMFQRLDNQYEGTGIGLAIVRKVVERMGGKVGVESQPGEGCSFWVELPVANDGNKKRITKT